MRRTEVVLITDAECESGEHSIPAGSRVWAYSSWKRIESNKNYSGGHHLAFMCDDCYKKRTIIRAMKIDEK
jgi:hypothetical protein